MKTVNHVTVAVGLLLGLTVQAFCQHYVPLAPLNRNAIYEEFTGVKCPNCPSGHQVLAQILAANPGRAFAVAYHPFNSSYTLPYAGDPDFRRHYADSLYMTPYCGTSRYMPSAFVQRRLWSPPERLTERTNWAAYGNTVMNEPSPVNVGMASRYDPATQTLTVVADVYYTASVTGPHTLMVTLAENNLQSQQSGGTAPYTHKHTFREAFVGQWGDPLSENAQAGSFFRKTFTFGNATANYDMNQCELLAFVVDAGSDEVISGIGALVGDTTYLTPEATLSADTLFFNDATQCFQGQTMFIRNTTPEPVELLDVQPASLVPGSAFNWYVDPWPFTTFPHTLAPGDSVGITVKVALPTVAAPSGYLLDSLYIKQPLGTRFVMIAADEDLFTSIPGATPASMSAVLYQNTPNPCRLETRIRFYLPAPSDVRLDVIDLAGNRVKTLASGNTLSGLHACTWDGCADDGRRLPAGIYLLRLTTPAGVTARRMVVMP